MHVTSIHIIHMNTSPYIHSVLPYQYWYINRDKYINRQIQRALLSAPESLCLAIALNALCIRYAYCLYKKIKNQVLRSLFVNFRDIDIIIMKIVYEFAGLF